MAGLDKVVEKLNSQKSKKKTTKKKKEEEIEEDLEDEEEEETEEEEDEDLEDEDTEDSEEEDEEEEEEPTPKPLAVKKETQEALRRRNEEIHLLHNNGLFRYEILAQLLELNDTLKKLLALVTPKKDGKK